MTKSFPQQDPSEVWAMTYNSVSWTSYTDNTPSASKATSPSAQAARVAILDAAQDTPQDYQTTTTRSPTVAEAIIRRLPCWGELGKKTQEGLVATPADPVQVVDENGCLQSLQRTLLGASLTQKLTDKYPLQWESFTKALAYIGLLVARFFRSHSSSTGTNDTSSAAPPRPRANSRYLEMSQNCGLER